MLRRLLVAGLIGMGVLLAGRDAASHGRVTVSDASGPTAIDAVVTRGDPPTAGVSERLPVHDSTPAHGTEAGAEALSPVPVGPDPPTPVIEPTQSSTPATGSVDSTGDFVPAGRADVGSTQIPAVSPSTGAVPPAPVGAAAPSVSLAPTVPVGATPRDQPELGRTQSASPTVMQARDLRRAGVLALAAGGLLGIGAVVMATLPACASRAGNSCSEPAKWRAFATLVVPAGGLLVGGGTMTTVAALRLRRAEIIPVARLGRGHVGAQLMLRF